MFTKFRTLAPLALACLLLVRCATPIVPEAPTDFETLRDVSDALLAYERGDCKTASRLSDPIRIQSWEPNEALHSMLLLNGFCKELGGDLTGAQKIYDRLLDEAPNSFAARDAKERSRIIQINASDPSHAAWMRDAHERALVAQSNPSSRQPIERVPANFPPIARANGIEGYAVVGFGVTPRGATSDPIVIESSPPLLFDGASVRAIRRWEYTRTSARTNDFQVIRLVFIGEATQPLPPATPDDAAALPVEDQSAEQDR